MFNEMNKKNLYMPLYLPQNYTPNSVCVILFNEERTTYWDIVEKYLDENGIITIFISMAFFSCTNTPVVQETK